MLVPDRTQFGTDRVTIMSLVRTESRGQVRVVVMDHVERRNALSEAMVAEIVAALRDAARDECRAFVLRAPAGAAVWSSGHDLAELPEDPTDWVSPVERLLAAVVDSPFPVIAAVEGGAWGASCNLALACDLVLATTSATFAITPARLGLAYHLDGVAQLLAAVPPHVAREMLYTAEPVPAPVLYRLGAVNRLVADGDALGRDAMALADLISSRAPLSIQAAKGDIAALTQGRPLGEAERAALDARRRRAWSSLDLQEGIAAFGEKRVPEFQGR